MELGVKNPAANAGDTRHVGSIPGSGRFPGKGNSNPFQYVCLENPVDRGAWQNTVHGVAKSWTQLMRLSTQASQCLGHRKHSKNTEHMSGSPPCEVASLMSQCTDEETDSRKSGDLPSASAVGTLVTLAHFSDPNAFMPGHLLPTLGSSAACTPICPLRVSHSLLPPFCSQPEERRHLHTFPSRILTTGITTMKTKQLISLVLFPVSPTRMQARPGKGLHPSCSFSSPRSLAQSGC